MTGCHGVTIIDDTIQYYIRRGFISFEEKKYDLLLSK